MRIEFENFVLSYELGNTPHEVQAALIVHDGLSKIARSLSNIADRLGEIGMHGPGGVPGALEFIGMEIRDKGEEIATALNNIADSIPL